MRNIVIGYGEIGKSVGAVIGEHEKIDEGMLAPPVTDEAVTLHICFPYSDKFVTAVQAYMEKYRPEHVIVYSTTAIGVCEQIGDKVVHSPVEGRHPELEMSIRMMERWLGTSDIKEGQYFTGFFMGRGISCRVVAHPNYTEALKLMSTSKFGINLVFADYQAGVAEEIGMDFQLVKDFDKEYNKLYRNIGMDWAQRYILDAPNGKIGGHCVVPNAKLLNTQFPSVLLNKIIEKEIIL